MAFCTDCGGLNAESLRFCIHCGQAIIESAKVAEVSSRKPISDAPSVQPAIITNSKKGNSKPLVAVLSVVVVVLIGVLFLISKSGSSSTFEEANTIPSTETSVVEQEVQSTETSVVEQEVQLVVSVPADAKPIEIGNWELIDSPTKYLMQEFSCDLLAISLEFDECLDASSMGGSFAVTVQKRLNQLENTDYFYFEVIKFVENGSSSFASPVFNNSIQNENLDYGMNLGAALQSLEISTGTTIGVQLRIYGPSRTFSSYIFWGLDSGKLPKLFAEFSGEGMRPLATDEFLILTEYAYRDGEPLCCGTLTNHYRVYMQPDRWFVQLKTLDKDEARAIEAGYSNPVETSELVIEGHLPELTDVAPEEDWIDGYEMAKPACDGSFITIIMSAGANGIISGVKAKSDASYLRTDITCASLNPTFSSGPLEGQQIYVLYYGPYQDRYVAQNKCLALGLNKKANCYVAPLTDDESDRQVRYGPKEK